MINFDIDEKLNKALIETSFDNLSKMELGLNGFINNLGKF